MRGVGDEILAHGFQPDLARDVADDQQPLARAVGDQVQREVHVVIEGRPDHDRQRVVPALDVADEIRLANEILDALAEVDPAPQRQQPGRVAVEPLDLAVGAEHDDPVRHRRRHAAELPEHQADAALVELLAAIDPHHQRDDIPPDAMEVRRLLRAPVAQPALQPVQAQQVEDEVTRQHGDDGGRQESGHPSHHGGRGEHAEQSCEGK